MSSSLLPDPAGISWHTGVVPEIFFGSVFRVYSVDAARVVENDEFGYGVSYIADQLAVSAWRYVFWGVVLEWCLVIAIASLSHATAICKDAEALMPVWLPPLALSVCFVGTWLEIAAARFLLPVLCKQLGGFELCGRRITFKTFYAGYMALSLMSRFSLVMSGIATVALLQSCRCSGNLIEPIWNKVISHSMMPWLPQLHTLFVTAWMMLLLQPGAALLSGVPCCDKDDLEYNQEKHTVLSLVGTNFIWTRKEVKPAFYALTGEVGVYQGTMTLASASRMMLLTSRHTDFYISSNIDWLDDPTSGSRHQWAAEMTRVAWQMFLNGSVAVLQMNLQASMLSIGKASTGRLRSTVMISIAAGCALAVYSTATSSLQIAQMAMRIWPVFHTGFDKYAEKGFADDSDYVRRDRKREHQAQRRVIVSVVVAMVMALVMVAGISYVVLKSMMLMICKDGLWNLNTGCMTWSPAMTSPLI